MKNRVSSLARSAGYLGIAQLRRLGIDVDRFPRHASCEALVSRLLQLYQVDHVIDVGASRGQWGVSVRASGWKGPITSFEPAPKSFRRLAKTAARDDKWEPKMLAIGSTQGTRPLRVAQSETTSSFLQATQNYCDRYSGARTVSIETVPINSLDNLWKEIGSPERAFLKIDTQGYDMEVLRGAKKKLESVVGLQVELSVISNYVGAPKWRDLLDWIERQGFVLSGLFPLERDARLRQTELDGVFVKADS